MSKIDGYNAYQNYYESSLQTRKSKESQDVKKNQPQTGWDMDPVKLDKSAKTENKSQVELSDAAQKLLEELKEKYSNMDFIIADYSTDEEAQQLLSRGTKEYSVLIDPQTLEKMAADEEVKQQYLDIIDQSTLQLDEMKEELKESGQDVKRIGFSVDDNGQITFFAELEKSSKAQSERIEASREKKRAEKKEEQKNAKEDAASQKQEEALETRRKERAEELYGKAPESLKRTTVTAATTEELLEKIRNVDWDSVPELASRYAGAKIDFSI